MRLDWERVELNGRQSSRARKQESVANGVPYFLVNIILLMGPKFRADAWNHRVIPMDVFASMAALLRDPEVVEELLRGLLRSISAVANDEIEANACVNYESWLLAGIQQSRK